MEEGQSSSLVLERNRYFSVHSGISSGQMDMVCVPRSGLSEKVGGTLNVPYSKVQKLQSLRCWNLLMLRFPLCRDRIFSG